MAVIARNGSKLVKEVRDKKEANKSRARFWEVAGSKMGKITGEPLFATHHWPKCCGCVWDCHVGIYGDTATAASGCCTSSLGQTELRT
jgi:hypothetical protein